MNHTAAGSPASSPSQDGRRPFLVRATAVVIGGIVALFPFVVGMGVVFDPLRRRRDDSSGNKAPEGLWVRICALDALPADGVPRPFAVTTDITDAWTRAKGQRIGSVFLTRSRSNTPHVTALSATCPHLGCAVDYEAGAGRFECPCHESGFTKDGQRLFGPSLRGLDPLAVKLIEKDGQSAVWIDYERFRAGVAERIPIA